jgi:hypothetical protein
MMFRNPIKTVLIVLIATLIIVSTALAATIDPITRTVTTSAFDIQFSASNPEEISYLSWNGSGNLTSTGVIPVSGCTGDTLEYFGNSWASPDTGDFVSLVGWGQSGTWSSPNSHKVSIDSTSESASGCYGSLDIPVETNYQFWDRGPAANRFVVRRIFNFGTTPFTQNFRPYIPRLAPLDAYTAVYHPNASGTVLLLEDPALCEFGCQISDWDDTWFAVHNPTTGQGMIVRHVPSGYDVDLWVDEDGASFASASGVLLIAPSRGFRRKVRETEFLCFYDNTIWTPSLTLPPGC